MSDDSNNLSNENPELWEFPCDFLFKAMAHAEPGVEDKIIAVIQKHIPGDYIPKIKPSKQGNYISVSVNFIATSKPQLDQIYQEVNQIDEVKFCL
jgi:putative lipoic acid-binding regulatory protein